MKTSNNLKADLHLHTTASDGRLTPSQLISLAAEKELNVIAITDHDTIEGIEPALNAIRDFNDINLIPGVEMNTDVPGMEVHILGYFIDFTNNKFISVLKEMQDSREIRAVKMLEKLGKLGINIDWRRLKDIAKDSVIGRPHVAQAMVDGGHVGSFVEAFDKYIGRNGPAYVEHKKMTPVEVIKLIIDIKGIPVLAHPDNITNLENMLEELKKAGLMGIEVYYGKYSVDTINRLITLAKKYDLILAGGSDFHAFNDERETMIGDVEIPADAIRKLYSVGLKTNPDLMVKYSLHLNI